MNNNDIDSLKQELSQLKTQFTERINNLEHRLTELGEPIDASADIAIINPMLTPDSVMQEPALTTPPKTMVEKPLVEKSAVPKKYKGPSYFEVMFYKVMTMIFDWFKPATKIYQSYKDRDMLGIFILTIMGIGLTLAGFGYLMQLLIDQIGAGAKSLLMFSVALSVMTLGIFIKRKTAFQEFATAIVALGLLLLYSTVYFAGSVYHVIPYIAVVVLYLGIALLSHVVALWLDTKIVAALGIVGIALMPILSNIIVEQPSYYLFSLAFVTISSLILAYRYVGLWLANLSLALVLMSLEWVINMDGSHLSVIFIDLFYLIFFSYVCVSFIKRPDAHKQSLIFLATLIGANLLFLFQVASLLTDSISTAFIINTLVAVGVSYLFFKLKHPLTHFTVLVTAIWTLLAAISLISQTYWNIAWAIEGLFLMYLGRRYFLPVVINQGQALTGISVLYGAIALMPYFPIPALLTLDGWMLSISLVLVIGIWLRLINNSDQFTTLTIQKIKPFLILLECVWLTVLILAFTDYWLGTWTAPLVILGQLALLLRAKSCRETSVEVFAALLIFVPVLYVIYIGEMTDNYHFSALPIAAKFAVLSIFAQLWLFAEYYRRYQPNSPMVKFSEWARIAFYLIIPICWVGSAIRNLDEYFLLIMWLAPAIAVFFAVKIKHKLIIWQAKILIGLASTCLILGVGFIAVLPGEIALVLFLAAYRAAFSLNKRSENDLYQFVCTWGILTMGFAVPIWIASLNYNEAYSAIFAALYWSILFNFVTQWTHAKRITMAIHLVSACLIMGAWFLLDESALYALVPLAYIVAACYKKEERFEQSMVGESLSKNSDLSIHVLGIVTYVVLLTTLPAYRLDLLIAPLLAVHGALILFMKDRRLTTVKFSFGLILLGIAKLALIDAANVLLWQKVILFMGIGIFILGASFWYQKLVKQTNDIEQSDDEIIELDSKEIQD